MRWMRWVLAAALMNMGLAACLSSEDRGDSALLGAEQDRCGADLTRWSLGSGEDSLRFDGIVDSRSYVVVSAGAGRAEFEAYWGVALAADAAFQRGDRWLVDGPLSLRFDDSTLLDGPTLTPVSDRSLSRRGNSPAGRSNGWAVVSIDAATPGSGQLSGPHIRISELGTVAGDSAEMAFVEIYTGGFTDDCAGSVEPPVEPPGEPVLPPLEPPIDNPQLPMDPPFEPFPLSCDTDMDCIDHPDGPACHPFGHFCGVDLSDWGILQSDEPRSRYFARPTIVRAHSRLIMARSGTQLEFEAFWGVTLGADVVFVSNGGHFPAIDGGESYQLLGPGLVSVGLRTPVVGTHEVLSHNDWLWSVSPPSPGEAECAPGISITEVADVVSEGYHDQEYVELCIGAPL